MPPPPRHRTFALLSLLAAVVSGARNFDDAAFRARRRVDDVEKSAGDPRAYRGLVLENGLTALLISDPDADMSAVSVLVGVGTYVV